MKPDVTRDSLVERRQRRIRRELTTTAMRLFFEKGYEATTVEEIVDAVEISPSTFYRHFPTKGDVVVEFFRMRFRAFGDALGGRPADESLSDALAAAVEAFALELGSDTWALRRFEELLEENAELRGRLLEELHGDLPFAAATIAPRLGCKPGDLRTEVVAAAITSTVRLAIQRWSRSGSGKQSPAQALQAALRVLSPLFEYAS